MRDTFRQDLRLAVRLLARNRGFATAAALSLALGIGANTAVFTLTDAVLLQMLPVRDPQRLVLLSWAATDWPSMVRSLNGTSSREPGRSTSTSFSYPAFQRIRDLNPSFESVFAFASLGRVTLTVAGESALASGQLVSAGYFSGLGVRPSAGRAFTADDDQPSAPAVAVISHGYWRRRFGGDPGAVGRPIAINGVPFTVVGVAPPEFFGLSPGESIEVFVPLALQPMVEPREAGEAAALFGAPDRWWVLMMARLRPGVTAAQAQAAVDVIFKHAAMEGAPAGSTRPVVPWLELTPGSRGLDSLRRRFSRPLLILMAVVAAVLLIACANVANLLLARAAARQKEMAVRLSLGTTRARLVRQLLTESLLLAALGALLGLVFACWGSRVLVALMSGGRNPIHLDVSPRLSVLGFTALASVVTAVLFGLAPALRATRVDVMPVLRDGAWSGTGRLRLGLAKALVVSQVALSLVLLVAAGLFGRTLGNLKALNVGFDAHNVLLFGIDATQAGYDGGRLADVYERVQQRLAGLPGVASATMSLHPLLSGSSSSTSINVPGAALPQSATGVRVLAVGPRFLETMRIPLLLGRDLDARDHESAPLVAVVNQTLAQRFFGGRSPLGERFGLGRAATGAEIEIVGVVKDARYHSLREAMPAVVYVPVRQRRGGPGAMTFEVRTAGDPKGLVASVRRAVAEVDGGLPLSGVKTQAEQVDELLLQEHLFAKLTGFFGVLALALVCVGLYGILSYAVARRTGEIGIRMALGAQRADILSMVLRETLQMVAIGVGAGVPAALAVGRSASRVISGLLFGLGPTDVATIAAATLVMAAVAVIAGLLPARRAARVDPMVALRYE